MIKPLLACILLSVAVLSCSDDSVKPQTFHGFWVLYEINGPDGKETGPFAGRSVFGFYAESIQFNPDGTYYPAMWLDEGNYFAFEERGGKFAYEIHADTIFLTEGQWDMDLKVVRNSFGELWLKNEGIIYKLRLWTP